MMSYVLQRKKDAAEIKSLKNEVKELKAELRKYENTQHYKSNITKSGDREPKNVIRIYNGKPED